MKNRKWKRIAGVLVALALLCGSLAGCSGKGNGEDGSSTGTEANGAAGGGSANGGSADSSGETAMGRFLEEEVTGAMLFGQIYDVVKMEDGTIRLAGSDADKGLRCAWDSKDAGETWEKAFEFPKEVQELSEDDPDGEPGYIDYAVLSKGGQVAVAYNQIGDGKVKSILYLIDKDGNGRQVPFEMPEAKAANADGSYDASAFGSVSVFGEVGDDESPDASSEPDGLEEKEQPEAEGSQDTEDPGSGTGDPGSVTEDSGSVTEDSGTEDPGSDAGGESDGGTFRRADGLTNYILGLSFLGEDQVLVKDMQDTVYQVNISDGSIKQTYESGESNLHQSYLVGNKLVVQTDTEVLVYDTETGEQQPKEDALQKSITESGYFQAVDSLDSGEGMYWLTSKGLYHYTFGGSVIEQVMDGSLNSLANPSFFVDSLLMLDEQNFLVIANDSSSDSPTGIAIVKFTYSADTPSRPDKELKAYSLHDSREMRQAISRYQKEHTDVYINYEVALSDDNGVTASDALKTLTTEIMAGKGPDVLILDGMPVETYAEKGILRDLSAVAAEAGGNYFENILNAYKDGQGQLCALPARFMMPMAQAGSAYYTPGEGFDSFMERTDALANMEPAEVVEKFWYTCGASWKKADGTLDGAKVAEFLTKLKNAYGEYQERGEEDVDIYMAMEGGGVSPLQGVSLDKGIFDLVSQKINSNIGLYGGMDYGMLRASTEKLENGDFGAMPGQVEKVFVPTMVMGVSSKSTQPEAAEEFVKYLFTQDAQKLAMAGGLPVDRDAFRGMIDGHEYEGKEDLGLVMVTGAGTEMDNAISYAMSPATEEEVKKLTDLAERLENPALMDDVIKEAVVEQGEKVLKGETEPQAAADAVMQKVNIYLAE